MSGSAEADKLPDIVFRGTDGNECEAFVVAIRRLAFAKGLEKDHYWMLHFATTCLRGKALRWHARLDSSIKDDWDLFVQALFDQYPSVEEPSDEVATPMWSATTFSPGISLAPLPQTQDSQPVGDGGDREHAPVRRSGAQCANILHINPSPRRKYDPASTELQIGLLHVITDGGTTPPQYVGRGRERDNGSCDYMRTTIDGQEALAVSFLPSPEPFRIGTLNSRACRGSITLGRSDQNAVESYMLYGNGDRGYVSGLQGDVWNVLADGSLQASLSGTFTTTEVHLDTSGYIWFVRPENKSQGGEARNKPSGPVIRARIVFEPL